MSLDLENKDEIISKIYYNESGYGSIIKTHKAAKAIDKTISVKYVSKWFDENVGKKGQPKGSNSFVAQYAFQEFQIDLCFFKDLPNQKYTTAMVCIDVFSKYAVVVPIIDRKVPAVAAGIIECFQSMMKKPEILFTDGETAFNDSLLIEYYKKYNIKHYVTRNHSAFAERFIRTLKDMLYKRIDGDTKKKEGYQWTDYLQQTMKTYNTVNIHSSTKKTPIEAIKPSQAIDVKTNLEIRALRNRKYPPLSIDDNVKILSKRKKGEKERVSKWSIEIFKVKSITKILGQDYYTLEGIERDYIRGEILRV
jgi:hypothetical protein